MRLQEKILKVLGTSKKMNRTNGDSLSESKYLILIGLVLFSSALLKIYYATKYVTYTDEILSAIVAKSIALTGLPTLPSGSIYNRAPLHHYLLAIPIGTFDMNYLSMRVNSIIFSVLAIFFTYSLGTRISSQRVAIFSAIILSISSFFNQFALSGRMYITSATFYVISIYFFYEGFIKGRRSAKWLSILSLMATMLSSEAGILLGVIYAFTLVVYHRTNWIKDKMVYAGFAVWALLFYLIWIYKIPGAYQPFTAHSGLTEPSVISYQMSMREIIINLSYPWRALDRSLPFSMPFFAVMTLLVIKKKEFLRHYPLVVLLPALIMESFFTYRVQYRIIVYLIPLYILACVQYIETLWRWTNKSKHLGYARSLTGSVARTFRIFIDIKLVSRVFIAGIILFLTTGIILANKINSPVEIGKYIYQAFGYHDSRRKENIEPAYTFLKPRVKTEDTIIVTTVEYGIYFLGTDYTYYLLRQRKINDSNKINFTTFTKEQEPYYGKPIIDSIEKLQKLMDYSTNIIWVVEDNKADSYVGPEVRSFIRKHFEHVYDGYPEMNTRIYSLKPMSMN